ncbi:hypothetical protein Tco_1307127 [Tanacetum coccineum]
MPNSPNVGVPPREGISLKSASCKLDLTCDSAVAYVYSRAARSVLLLPVHESWLSSPFQLVLLASISARALATPWEINAYFEHQS